MNIPPSGVRGFTLVEMAVAVVILALLLGSILVPLTTQVEQKQVSDAQKNIDEAKEALLGFAMVNGYLPCPDTDNDGLENVTAGTGQCTTSAANIAAGNLPWQTLGVANQDPWGNRYRYLVRENFARRSPSTTFTLSTTADIRVCQTAATCATNPYTTTAVAAVFSAGKNGNGATNVAGTSNTAPTSADEIENIVTHDRTLVWHVPSQVSSTAGEFDDIVSWLSVNVLLGKMISAGKLP
jgi:prepilin-type N-terminal cleavage/methylation domain-containing protein